ncbi:myristylated tegument protein [macacine betaherpesvirus 3]|uniref:Cytoplasmic envelopment protein 3 n=1 Tax=Rhesus cytomegalovirus (strain 68-1) TaxID=47929 RepID=Q2FAH3_RHCM6|nr:rh137 [macacine betaherpesvirus 3]AAP50661.1 rh137 [macacine betaherpesvirus 3]QMS44148.1 Rh137 [synthetic construct]QQL10602.1 Rh137 [Rhesus cytomegalovirus strain 68-1.2]QQL10784.1 Rh137 [Rhesus cytomegalovirus strain 68-1_FL]AAZ80643.1 rhUL99 [macacine betaherpesvirus 3]
MGGQCCKRICCFFGASSGKPLRDTMGRPVCLRSFADIDNTSSEEDEADLISINSDRLSLASQDSMAPAPKPKKKKKKTQSAQHTTQKAQLTLALMEDGDGYHSPPRVTRTYNRPSPPSKAKTPRAEKIAMRPPTPKNQRRSSSRGSYESVY